MAREIDRKGFLKAAVAGTASVAAASLLGGAVFAQDNEAETVNEFQ